MERMEAKKLFASGEAEEEAKKVSAKTFVPGEVPSTPEVSKEEQPSKPVGPTPEQIIAIKAAIVNSQTLEEVARLEQALKTGQIPADLGIPEVNDPAESENSKVDKMDTDTHKDGDNVNKDAEAEQQNDGPAEMEQE